jgi:peptidoglycan hydrolase CwlO-like protein
MEQKKLNIVLVVCVIALSIVCCWQFKKIRDLEDYISSVESDVSYMEDEIKELKYNVDSISSDVSDLQSELSGNYQRPSARELYNQLERKRQEELNRKKRK